MSKKPNLSPQKSKEKPVLTGDNSFQIELLRWIFSILFSVLTYSLLAYIIHEVYHPDVNKLLEESNKLSFLGMNRPEPVEGLIVRLGILVIPVLLYAYYYLLNQASWLKGFKNNFAFHLISVLVLIATVILFYKDFVALNPFNPGTGEQAQHIRDVDGKTNFDFYFKGLYLGKNIFTYLFICVPAVYCLFLLGFKKSKWEESAITKKYISSIVYLLLFTVVLSIVLMNVFNFPYTYENKYDFNAVYYSMTQVYAGTPMLVDGFTNTYGLYPHILNPLFQVTGLSVFNFSLVMSILLGFSFLFIILFFKRHIKNPVIALLGFLAMISFSYLNFRFTSAFDSSFAFYPIRFIVPSTLLLLTSLYLGKKSKPIYWITFILMGISILWNPEFGMVCFIAWLIVNTYVDFYTADNKVAYKKIAAHWVSGICVVALVFSAYAFAVYLSYGKTPDLKMMFSYILIFGKYGFGALPMSVIHPWNIAAIIYCIGLLFAIVKWYKKQITTSSSLVLLTSLIGIGFFIYFQGRSHNFTFATSTCFCFVLLSLLGSELWSLVKTKNILFLNLLFLVFLILTSYSIFELFTSTKKIGDLVYQKNDRANQSSEEQIIKNNESFIINNTKPFEKIHVFTSRENEGLYFNGNKRASAFNPGLLELALNSDLFRLESILYDSSFKVFIEPEKFNLFITSGTLDILAPRYRLEKSIGSMVLLTPHTNKIPEKVYFDADNNSVLHEKISGDTSGTRKRVALARGISPVILPPDFSIQLLFQPAKQVYQYATLIGNMTDTSGFMIAQNKESGKYIFCMNGKCYEIPVAETEWVYLVMNVFANKIEIYQNGNLSVSLLIEKSYHNSILNTFIGSMGFKRNYFGGISEVNISKGALAADEVQKNWRVMENDFRK